MVLHWKLIAGTALLAATLASCSRSFDTTQPRGATGTSVTCTGIAVAVRACVAEAGGACQSGHYAVYELGGGGQVGDDRNGIADRFLSLVQATGAQIVCTAHAPAPPPGVPAGI